MRVGAVEASTLWADFASVFDALEAIGAEPYMATEVFSSALAALGPAAAAVRNRDAVVRVLAGRG